MSRILLIAGGIIIVVAILWMAVAAVLLFKISDCFREETNK